MSKIRLDQYLCQNGLVQSRERAKALIMSGIVFVNEQKVDKAGEMIAPDAKVEVRGHDIGYVSRGGLKLEKAMQVFPMRPDGKVCMDIGASTGGFTDCMLQNGAVKVYAVDVGYGQLAWSLRTDERVINMERTNIRSVKPEDLSEPVAFFSVDVRRQCRRAENAGTAYRAVCGRHLWQRYTAGRAGGYPGHAGQPRVAAHRRRRHDCPADRKARWSV